MKFWKIILILLGIFILTGIASANYPYFAHNQSLTLSNNPGAGNITKINITYYNNASNPMQTDFDDLRFDNGSANLSYWMPYGPINTGINCTVYIKLPVATNNIYMHWGNATVGNESNISIMDLGDDFSGSGINASTWLDRIGTYAASGGIANLTYANSVQAYLYSSAYFGRGNETIVRMRHNYTGSADAFFGFGQGSNDCTLDDYTGTTYFGLWNSVSGAVTENFTSLPTDTNWHNYSLIYNTTSNLTIDGKYSRTLDGSHTPNANLPVLFGIDIGGSEYIDYVAVRKLNGSDPVVTFGAVTENQTTQIPVADFTSDKTSGSTPLTVQFTDASTNTPTVWQWSWGDSTANGTTQNPSHQYTNPGTYTVILTAGNTAGNNTVTKTNYISARKTAPIITWGTLANIIYGTALSGTQNGATANVPGTFTYYYVNNTVLGVGTYTLSLNFTPTDQGTYATATATNTLNITKATPTITWSNPANITNAIALNGTQLNAAASAPGTFAYTPDLGVYLDSGNQTLNTVFTPTDSANYTTASKTVYVNVTTSISWYWDFGDGTNSTLQNPTHQYTNSGIYTVTENVTNGTNTDSLIKTNYIIVTSPTSKPITRFTANSTFNAKPMSVQFNDTTSGSPTSWSWNFGDGNNSTTENPLHNYTKAGIFTVSLNATNTLGSNITKKLNYIISVDTSSHSLIWWKYWYMSHGWRV